MSIVNYCNPYWCSSSSRGSCFVISWWSCPRGSSVRDQTRKSWWWLETIQRHRPFKGHTLVVAWEFYVFPPTWACLIFACFFTFWCRWSIRAPGTFIVSQVHYTFCLQLRWWRSRRFLSFSKTCHCSFCHHPRCHELLVMGCIQA